MCAHDIEFPGQRPSLLDGESDNIGGKRRSRRQAGKARDPKSRAEDDDVHITHERLHVVSPGPPRRATKPRDGS
jgi:hypothetical protein